MDACRLHLGLTVSSTSKLIWLSFITLAGMEAVTTLSIVLIDWVDKLNFADKHDHKTVIDPDFNVRHDG